ncbi:MAG: hypothetical protein IKQ60_06455 [Candidatus Methanomethylophilaceae archaeon]|nr:hypothetical protein [Candidatus Methanomethylophilaceae archaeon]
MSPAGIQSFRFSASLFRRWWSRSLAAMRQTSRALMDLSAMGFSERKRSLSATSTSKSVW